MIRLQPFPARALPDTLLEWQRDGIHAVHAHLTEGAKRVLCVAATGMGKSVFLGNVARAFDARTLILAHREELIDQLAATVGRWWPEASVGKVMAHHHEPDAQVVVATVQTLAGRLHRTPGPFDLVIIDECFPAGTMVDGRPIETLRLGDTVTTWNEARQCMSSGTITHVFKRPAAQLITVILDTERRLTCTPNHPILTGRGWVAAGDLTNNDKVATHGENQPVRVRSMRDRVRVGLGDAAKQHEEDREGVLRQDVQHRRQERRRTRPGREASTRLPLVQGRIRRRLVPEIDARTDRPDLLLQGVLVGVPSVGLIRDDGRDEPTTRVRPHDGEQPDGEGRDPGAGIGLAETDGSSSVGRGRERTRVHRAATSALRSTVRQRGRRLGAGARSSDWTGPRGLAEGVQGGYRQPGDPAVRGGRRVLAQRPSGAGSGRTEDGVPGWARVDRIEVHEPGSDGRFGGLCPDGFVYNLEVEADHTYVANGVVVHNCHHVMAATYQTILDHYCGTADLLPGMPPPDSAPVVLGVTATPDRADRKGVAEWFGHRIAFSYDTRWAIDQGYLCDLRTLTVRMENLDLDGVQIRKGDYADGDLGRALQTAGAPKLIVDAWTQHGEDRQTMVFSPTVEMSKAVTAAFVAAGVPAEHMDGGGRKDDRRAVLDRFRAGQTKVILNVALWTEGVDIPETSCVILARPSRSRALVSQAIGRGLRLAPGKADCIVIDLSGATKDNKLVQAHDLLGLHRALERHESAKQAMEREDAAERTAKPDTHEQDESWTHGPARFANTDPFGRPAGCKYPWRHDPSPTCVDRWTHDFDGTRVVVRRGDPAARTWLAGAYDLATKTPTEIATSPLIGKVLDAAEAFIDGTRPAGAWKADAPTAAQVHALRRAGWTGDPTTITKAKAGAILGKHRAAEKATRQAADANRDATAAAGVTIPRIEAAIGGRRMINATDVPSMLGLTPGPVVDDTARRTLAAMEAKGMLRRQGESYVVLRNVEGAA